MATLASETERHRNVLRVLLVCERPEQGGALKKALQALNDPPLELIEDAAGISAGNGGPPSDAAIFVFNGEEEAMLARLQAESRQSPRPVLLALLSGRSAGLMKRALRAGADELLFLPIDPGDTTRALLKISEARRRAERRDGGVVCSVASLVGGVGVTSVAANLGLALRYELRQRVALVDLDLQTGGLSVFLNLEPEVTITPLVRLERKLDSIQLESALTKHSSGIYLLAAPKRIEESELVSDITVSTVIDLLRQLFDYVIVDCGDHVDENAVAAWERSEQLFYILDQSVAAARCAWRFIDLFERLKLRTLEPRFVLNRHLPSHPLGDKHLETTLARPLHAKIPADDRAMERAELTAQDLWQVAPGSALARSYVELAHGINPHSETVAEAEPGLISRLRSAFSARA